jgi:hypothetical protein
MPSSWTGWTLGSDVLLRIGAGETETGYSLSLPMIVVVSVLQNHPRTVTLVVREEITDTELVPI